MQNSITSHNNTKKCIIFLDKQSYNLNYSLFLYKQIQLLSSNIFKITISQMPTLK